MMIKEPCIYRTMLFIIKKRGKYYKRDGYLIRNLEGMGLTKILSLLGEL